MKNILIVEDSTTYLNLLCEVLKNKGYKVKGASSVKSALEEIKKEPVTVLLILINTLIFLVVEFTGGSENGQHMLECGAAYAPLILEQGQWYRLFSSMFLHFGAPHLINNMLVLFVLGQRLEPVTGKIKFFLIQKTMETRG